MTLIDTIVSTGVLVSLFVLAYCKWTGRTLLDLFLEIKEMFSSQREDVEIDFT